MARVSAFARTMKYFREADWDEAREALESAASIIRVRSGPAKPRKTRKAKVMDATGAFVNEEK